MVSCYVLQIVCRAYTNIVLCNAGSPSIKTYLLGGMCA